MDCTALGGLQTQRNGARESVQRVFSATTPRWLQYALFAVQLFAQCHNDGQLRRAYSTMLLSPHGA